MAKMSRLRGKIIERETTQEAVADRMGIDRSTFYRKMKKGGNPFTVEDVQKIAEILALTSTEVMKIFFDM
ncbi:MAG: helix-turn-helix domain-containing protein [Clostridium sp.]|jgi:transcriptional regulator with XRE-family HTH domain|nr:helix-turn-helix domain-containing protein [Clostridium sp.]